MEVIGGDALFDWLEKIFPKPETGYESHDDRDDDVCGAFPQHLTRIRRHFVIYFCLHRGKCAVKGGKLASHKRAYKNRLYDKILLVISGDRILGASPKGRFVCCTVSLTRFG
jgi:hypothetical protein